MSALATITVSVLSKKSGVSIDAIRSYERLGLIPKPAAAAGGLRLYRIEDVERLIFIRGAQDLDFSVEAVREMITISQAQSGTCADIYGIADRHLADIRRRRRTDHDQVEKALAGLVLCCPQTGPAADCPILNALAGSARAFHARGELPSGSAVLGAPSADHHLRDGRQAEHRVLHVSDLVEALRKIEAHVTAFMSVPDSPQAAEALVNSIEAGRAILQEQFGFGPGFDFLQDRISRQCEDVLASFASVRSEPQSNAPLKQVRRLDDMIKAIFTQI